METRRHSNWLTVQAGSGPQMSDPKFRRNRRLISSRLMKWFWPPRDAILIEPINAASLDPLAVRVDDRPLCAPGENECLEFVRHFFELAASPLLEEPALVVVDSHVGRLFHESAQLFT